MKLTILEFEKTRRYLKHVTNYLPSNTSYLGFEHAMNLKFTCIFSKCRGIPVDTC